MGVTRSRKKNKNIRQIVFDECGGVCPVCGCKMQNKNQNESNFMTLDHIIPKSKGGNSTISNIQGMCKTCNNIKGNNMPEILGVIEMFFQT